MAILSGAAEKQLVFFFSFWIGLFYLLLIIFVCTSKRKGSRLLRVKNGGWWSGQSRLPSGPSKSFEKIKKNRRENFPVFSFVYFCDVCRFGLFCFDLLRLFVWVHNSHNCPSRGRPLLPGVRIVRASMISRAPADANFVNFICFFCCVRAAGNEHKRSVWLPLCSDNFRQFYLHFIIFSHSNFITKFVEVFL